MSTTNAIVRLLALAILTVAASVGLFGQAQAQTPSRVAVTQSTENNPLGKPPGGVERILRVGTDVQTNEIITTGGSDRAHLVFLDGTTVTLGPNSTLTIDKFVYDPTTQKGELALSSGTGVFRLIGGRITKSSEATIKTPAATLGIRGGITVWSGNVVTKSTSAYLVFGELLSVTSGNTTVTATLPGQLVTALQGLPPAPPTFTLQGNLDAAMAALVGNQQALQSVADALILLQQNNQLGTESALQLVLQTIINSTGFYNVSRSDITTNVSFIENPNQSPGNDGVNKPAPPPPPGTATVTVTPAILEISQQSAGSQQ